jgi:regulator of nonsense transcripts 2
MFQTRTIEFPSDSNFAIAMQSQKQAEREEQQRIKNLVLNYEMSDEQHDGEDDSHISVLLPNPNTKGIKGIERHSHTRPDKSGSNRGGQRARKLQLSDVEWYDLSMKPGSRQNRDPQKKDG